MLFLLQKANKYLQTAAGIFNQLKDRVVAAIEQEPTPGRNNIFRQL